VLALAGTTAAVKSAPSESADLREMFSSPQSGGVRDEQAPHPISGEPLLAASFRRHANNL